MAINLSRYLDDWLVLAASRDVYIPSNKRPGSSAISRAGDSDQFSQSSLIPAQTVTCLGIIFNSTVLKASLTEKQIEHFAVSENNFYLSILIQLVSGDLSWVISLLWLSSRKEVSTVSDEKTMGLPRWFSHHQVGLSLPDVPLVVPETSDKLSSVFSPRLSLLVWLLRSVGGGYLGSEAASGL